MSHTLQSVIFSFEYISKKLCPLADSLAHSPLNCTLIQMKVWQK